MRARELRERLLDRVAEAAASGDEAVVAVVAAYARAALVALAPYQPDHEVVLRSLQIGSKTAALILGMHPEYVRTLIRRGFLPATKENGEFRLRLDDVVEYSVRRMSSADIGAWMPWQFRPQKMVPLWKRREDCPDAEKG